MEAFRSRVWVKQERANASSTFGLVLGVHAEDPKAIVDYFWKVSDPEYASESESR